MCDIDHEKNRECYETWQMARVLFDPSWNILRHFVFWSLIKMAVEIFNITSQLKNRLHTHNTRREVRKYTVS